MSTITINSHDLLGKLSIVKNYLSVVLSDALLSEDAKTKIQTAFDTTEEMIRTVESLAKQSPEVQESTE